MSVAKTYAKALFEAAAEGKDASFDEIQQQLDQFVQLLGSSKEARVALVSPVTTSKEKAALVQATAERMGLKPLVARFLSMLAVKGRMRFLSRVRDAFRDVRLEAEGGVPGKLISAEPISDADVDNLAQAFGRKLGKKIAFQVSMDPSLLAGVRVTVQGVTYDGSLRSQLEKLRDQFVSNATAR